MDGWRGEGMMQVEGMRDWGGDGWMSGQTVSTADAN